MRRPTSARHDSEPCSHSPRAAALPPPCSSHVTPAPRSTLGPPDQAGSSSSPLTLERRWTLPYGDTRQSMRRLTANMSRRATLPGELVHHVQHPELAPVPGTVLDKVIGPDMVRPLWPQPHA